MDNDQSLFTDNMKEPIDAFRWFFLLLTWDGILPAAMAAAPTVIRWLWPGNMLVRDMVVVLILIVALFVRVCVGIAHVNDNYCSINTRRLQKFVLFAMAFFLVLMDCLLMTVPVQPGMPEGDMIFLAIAAGIYLSGMAFVLYPGRAPASNSTFGDSYLNED